MDIVRTAAHDVAKSFEHLWEHHQSLGQDTLRDLLLLKVDVGILRSTIALVPPGTNILGSYHTDGTDTEKASASFVMPRTGTQRASVLAELSNAYPGGLTDDEIGERLPLYVNTGAKRRNDLKNQGWVQDSGVRRLTQTGAPAVVWELTPQGADSLQCHPRMVQ